MKMAKNSKNQKVEQGNIDKNSRLFRQQKQVAAVRASATLCFRSKELSLNCLFTAPCARRLRKLTGSQVIQTQFILPISVNV